MHICCCRSVIYCFSSVSSVTLHPIPPLEKFSCLVGYINGGVKMWRFLKKQRDAAPNSAFGKAVLCGGFHQRWCQAYKKQRRKNGAVGMLRERVLLWCQGRCAADGTGHARTDGAGTSRLRSPYQRKRARPRGCRRRAANRAAVRRRRSNPG